VSGTKIHPGHTSVYRLFGASHDLSLAIPKDWLSSSRSEENRRPHHSVGRKGCPKETGPERPSHPTPGRLPSSRDRKDPHPRHHAARLLPSWKDSRKTRLRRENICFPRSCQPLRTQPRFDILCLFSPIPLPSSNAGKCCENTSFPTPARCKVRFEHGLLRMSCLRPTAALRLGSGTPETVRSRGSEQRERCWQPSKLDFSTAPTDGLQRVCGFFGFASFPAISAEPAPLIIRAQELFGLSYSQRISSKHKSSAPRLTVSAKKGAAQGAFRVQMRQKVASQPSLSPPTPSPATAGTVSQGSLSLAQPHGLSAALRSPPSYGAPSQHIYHKKAP